MTSAFDTLGALPEDDDLVEEADYDLNARLESCDLTCIEAELSHPSHDGQFVKITVLRSDQTQCFVAVILPSSIDGNGQRQ